MQFWSRKNIKDYPEFWKHYLKLFDAGKNNVSLDDIRFVAFDTETTGFDYDTDRVLSIGAVAISNNAIDVSDQLEIYLDQNVFNEATVAIHGIRKHGNYDKISEFDALQLFIDYIGDAILIAHHAEFDRKMIDRALQRRGLGTLKNKILDTGVLFKNTKHSVYLSGYSNRHYSLDELCNDLKISKSDRHTASGDAYITALAFLKILSRLKKDKRVTIKDVFRLK